MRQAIEGGAVRGRRFLIPLVSRHVIR
jgi:hypothetical protein